MMKKLSLIFGVCVALATTACNNDDDTPEQIEDHEGIEEVVLRFTATDGTATDYSFTSGQSTGETINLAVNSTYAMEVVELNGEEDGVEGNLIGEIVEEVEDHFFVYELADVTFGFTRTDSAETTREDGTLVGVKAQIVTSTAGSGTFKVILKHEPTSVDDSANNGLGSSEGGSTDVEATYPIVIE